MKTQEWVNKASKQIENAGGQFTFTEIPPDLQDLLFWSNSLAGESGELANQVKKMVRGDKVDLNKLIAEVADVALNCFILADKLGIDLETEVRNKLVDSAQKKEGITLDKS